MHLTILGTLFLANLFVWSIPTPHGLQVAFFDVGEGDAIFIQGPTGVQILVDGGPMDGGILRHIGQTIPFFDRSLNAVVMSGVSADNSTGLLDVFSRYEVGAFIESGIVPESKTARAVLEVGEEKAARHRVARRGMRLDLGGGAYADILYPDSDISSATSANGSLVMRVVYGNTSFLLTGDASQKIEKYLLTLDGGALTSDVLKAGHHGAKSSSASEFAQAVAPRYVVFSRGCDNRYGYPSPEVVSLFEELPARTLDTCENGTVTFISDGSHLERVAR